MKDNGSGWNYEKNRSYRAITAESDGLLTAGKFAVWARKNGFPGCRACHVVAALEPAEEHHHGRSMNLVQYFDPECLGEMPWFSKDQPYSYFLKIEIERDAK